MMLPTRALVVLSLFVSSWAQYQKNIGAESNGNSVEGYGPALTQYASAAQAQTDKTQTDQGALPDILFVVPVIEKPSGTVEVNGFASGYSPSPVVQSGLQQGYSSSNTVPQQQGYNSSPAPAPAPAPAPTATQQHGGYGSSQTAPAPPTNQRHSGYGSNQPAPGPPTNKQPVGYGPNQPVPSTNQQHVGYGSNQPVAPPQPIGYAPSTQSVGQPLPAAQTRYIQTAQSDPTPVQLISGSAGYPPLRVQPAPPSQQIRNQNGYGSPQALQPQPAPAQPSGYGQPQDATPDQQPSFVSFGYEFHQPQQASQATQNIPTGYGPAPSQNSQAGYGPVQQAQMQQMLAKFRDFQRMQQQMKQQQQRQQNRYQQQQTQQMFQPDQQQNVGYGQHSNRVSTSNAALAQSNFGYSQQSVGSPGSFQFPMKEYGSASTQQVGYGSSNMNGATGQQNDSSDKKKTIIKVALKPILNGGYSQNLPEVSYTILRGKPQQNSNQGSQNGPVMPVGPSTNVQNPHTQYNQPRPAPTLSRSYSDKMISQPGPGRQRSGGYGAPRAPPTQGGFERVQVSAPPRGYSATPGGHERVQVSAPPRGYSATPGGYERVQVSAVEVSGYGARPPPSAYDICEAEYDFSNFCSGKYAGLYSHPDPSCFLQCDQTTRATTSMCAPGTVWDKASYEPSKTNRCVHAGTASTQY